MPQCSPSARPRNKAQWLHCQQAFSCTFIGLPDTRPLLVFNKQHNNLFRGRSNGPLLHRGAERDYSALNGRCLRCFLSFLWIFFIPTLQLTCYDRMGDYHRVAARSAVGHVLLPDGFRVKLLKTQKPQGLKTLLCIQRVQRFLDKWMQANSYSGKKNGKCGMNDSQQ